MQKYDVEQFNLYGDGDKRERKTHPFWETVYLASDVDARIVELERSNASLYKVIEERGRNLTSLDHELSQAASSVECKTARILELEKALRSIVDTSRATCASANHVLVHRQLVGEANRLLMGT